MTDLDEAKELLMALTKQGVSTEPSLHRAVMLLLVDYIQRASGALADAAKKIAWGIPALSHSRD
jgi:hypothetical protein